MNQNIQIGPLSLPIDMLILIFSVSFALGIGNRIAKKTGAVVENQLHVILLIGFVTAKLAFVSTYYHEYLASPWHIIDIRDGGWLSWIGLIGAWLYTVILIYKMPKLRKSLLSALSSFSIIWIIGSQYSLLLPASQSVELQHQQ